MPRLFVALELPEPIRLKLAAMRPATVRGVKLTPESHLHCTLHFIGETDLDAVRNVLSEVKCPTFQLRLQGVGQFPPGGKASILWAGIAASDSLAMLHAEISAALQLTGYQPESRPFTPHITLARLGPQTPLAVSQFFLKQYANWEQPAFQVHEFTLFSSVLTENGPIYTAEVRYSLGENRGGS